MEKGGNEYLTSECLNNNVNIREETKKKQVGEKENGKIIKV